MPAAPEHPATMEAENMNRSCTDFCKIEQKVHSRNSQADYWRHVTRFGQQVFWEAYKQVLDCSLDNDMIRLDFDVVFVWHFDNWSCVGILG